MDSGLENTAPELVIGGKYRVVRLLGQGGMGAVYEAENSFTKRRVAIKVMRPEIAASEIYAQRFLREAQAATRLAHPHIVDVLDMGRDEALATLYIVQEFLVGHDLAKHLEAAGRMPPADALAVLVPVMEALVVAHSHGIVHRDLKPDNIFLAETPRGIVPKLIDFGIAKVANAADGQKITITTTQMGTPYYMSPEQALGESDLDARSDVWSLGVVLYEVLAGVRPYRAAPRSGANALMAKIIYEEPIALAEAAPDLPRDLTDVVMGALRKPRAERYATMQGFLDAVQGWAAAAGVAAPRAVAVSMPGLRGPTPVPGRAATPVPTPAPVSASQSFGAAAREPAAARESRGGTLVPTAHTVLPRLGRRGPKVLALGLGMLGVGALAAVLTLPRGDGAPPAAHQEAAHGPPPVTPVTPVVPAPPRPAGPAVTPVARPLVAAVPGNTPPAPGARPPREVADTTRPVDEATPAHAAPDAVVAGRHRHGSRSHSAAGSPGQAAPTVHITVGMPGAQPAPAHAAPGAPPGTSNSVGNL